MKHILIVDDNKTNLAAAKSALSDTYKTTAVISGAQALKFLEKNTADLILLDINMPEMDGFEVMEHIRSMENCENIPIVFLTADNEPDTETHCLEAGALDFIAKPFVTPVMLSRIGRILELEDLHKSLSDRLDRKIQEVSEMKSRSYKDALTGLWNRAYTEDAVDAMLREGVKGALFMIDMDNFKAINDNYGHLEGDKTLKFFAEIMTKYAGEGDVLCRIGGDEFVTFIKDQTSKSVLGNHAADIISDICHQLEECKYETNSSVSIGIAQCPEDGTDFKTLYNAADKALYYVKQNGKNSYHFFSEQNAAERERSANGIDMAYLCELMKRSDAGRGAYLIDYDNFHHVYNFIRRLVERSKREVQYALFTIHEAEGMPESLLAAAAECLEQAVYTSLRRVDVATRYSTKQIIVMLMDTSAENAVIAAERVMNCFNRLYTGDVKVTYNIETVIGREAVSSGK